MRSRKEKVIVYAILAMLGVVYICRYVQLNMAYQELRTGWDEFYHLGDEVSFGENYINTSMQAEGYSIEAEDVEIVDTLAYVHEKGISMKERQASIPERLMLVSTTIRNTDGDGGIPVLLFELYGIDSYTLVDFEMFEMINKNVDLWGWGIALPQNTEQTVIIPFRLDRDMFNYYTWNHLEKYPFSMRLTYGPAHMFINLMEK